MEILQTFATFLAFFVGLGLCMAVGLIAFMLAIVAFTKIISFFGIDFEWF